MNFDLSFLSGYEAIIAIALGIFLCLFGYKLKRVAFVIIWFAIGYYLMSMAAPHITGDPNWQKLLPIVAGVVLGVFGFSLEKLCIFAVATYAISTTLIDSFQITDPLYIALAIAAGIIVGIFAIKLIKPFGIITTAFSGAKLVAKYSLIELATMNHPIQHYPSFMIILLAAAAIGILYQFKSCKHLS